MIKKVISSIAFIVIFIAIFSYLNKEVFWISGDGDTIDAYAVATNNIYENKDLYDVVFIGSSHANCTFYPKVFWEQYGISSYVFSSSGQELYVSEYYLKEALKVQKPEVVVLELIGAAMGSGFRVELNNESSIMTSYSTTPFSIDKLQTLNYAFSEGTIADKLLPIFPLINYHENWKTLEIENFMPVDYEKFAYNNGAFLYERSVAGLIEPEGLTQDTGDFLEKSRQSLYDIIDICEENNIELIWTVAPYPIDDTTQAVINSVSLIAEEQGIPFIDYNKLYTETALDFSSDFFDADHLNIAGMGKISSHMGDYLMQNYDLPDRRGQAGYESFELMDEKEYLF